MTRARSPIDGVIADRSVYPGDIAPAGTPLFIVMDTSKVVARVHIPQSQAVLLKLGDAATLHVPGLQANVPGKVTVISPALDPSSTTVEIWVVAGNPNRNLQPGSSVGVSIVAQTVPDALVIPQSAVLAENSGPGHVVVIGKDGLTHSRDVTTGIQQGTLVQILTGLHAGEQIVVSGAYGLPDKTKVQATPAKSGAEAQL